MILQDQFRGIAPKISEKKLPKSFGTISENVVMRGGKLRPLRGILDVANVSNAPAMKSLIFRKEDGSWLYSQDMRHYVRSFLPGDQLGFLYYTDQVKPSFVINGSGAPQDLGIPRPGLVVLNVMDSGDTEDPNNTRRSAYKVVWVDGYGRVGPPSEVVVENTEVGPGAIIQVTRPAPPTGNFNGNGAQWYIYRTNTGSNGSTDYQFVSAVPLATTTFTDNVEPEALNEVIESDAWIGPPDALDGLILGPADSLFGFTENEVFASEKLIPHAWPYSWGFQQTIRGLAHVNGGVFVATDGAPFIIAGSEPANMEKINIESSSACLSSRSLVDMGQAAIYASTNGLYGASGSSVVNLTDELFDEESWKAYQPETIRAFKHGKYYVGFYGDTDSNTGFIFDPGTKDFMTINGPRPTVGTYDPDSDETHVLYYDGSDLRHGKFDEGSPLSYRWKGGLQVLPDFTSFVCCRVEADSYPVHLELTGDSETLSLTISDDDLFMLPGDFEAKRWTYQVSGEAEVDFIGLFETLSEVV